MLIRPRESLSERNEAAIVAFSRGGTRVGKHCRHVSPVAWRGPLQLPLWGSISAGIRYTSSAWISVVQSSCARDGHAARSELGWPTCRLALIGMACVGAHHLSRKAVWCSCGLGFTECNRTSLETLVAVKPATVAFHSDDRAILVANLALSGARGTEAADPIRWSASSE
jgi:hypothetical protein